MKTEVLWLVYTVLMTTAQWVPYILHMILRQGLWNAMGYRTDLPAVDEWAVRAKKAHLNSVENLVLFAPLVLAYHSLGGSGGILTAMQLYFGMRVLHYFAYVFKIPVARTGTFFVSVIALILIALEVISAAG